MAYRCHRAIGGSWTERLHAHADVAALAATWSTQAGWPSPRTCPLCQSGPGTPRHVIMSCKALAPAADMLRDDMEAELQSLASALRQAAQAWQHQARADALPVQCAAQDALRWPILSAWRWLVVLPGREPLLSVMWMVAALLPAWSHRRRWSILPPSANPSPMQWRRFRQLATLPG
eukprot:s6357_g2.t1